MKLCRNMTNKEYLSKQLTKELKRSSKGTIPKAERKELAEKTVSRLDLTNTFQMHKSMSAYADMLVERRHV